MGQQAPLLEVRDLTVTFAGRRRGNLVRAVDGISLTIEAGKTLGVVGESGSGKSTLGNAILGLATPDAGQILFHGQDITHASPRQRRELAHRIQVIFQDPHGSLNPSRTIGHTLAEPLRVNSHLTRAQAGQRVGEVLAMVGLPKAAAGRYPRQFSGGQRQRIAIARALILNPELIICDEPTSALDMSVQAQILNLLLALQEELGLTYLFISHDVDVVCHLAHRVAVMLGGRLVEEGLIDQVTTQPDHPYTRALLAAAPALDPRQQAANRRISEHNSRSAPPTSAAGYPFVSRCPTVQYE